MKLLDPSDAPVFRPGSASDALAIAQLLTTSGLPTAGVEAMLSRDATQFIVAHDAHGALVAMAGVEACCEHALLRSVAVRADWQQRGLGHQLIERAVSQADARGLRALYLLTMTAEQYFPRFGFERVERASVPEAVASTVEFASACPASAVAMRKTLSTTVPTTVAETLVDAS
jgi:amino-acid N-acetyltransferase